LDPKVLQIKVINTDGLCGCGFSWRVCWRRLTQQRQGWLKVRRPPPSAGRGALGLWLLLALSSAPAYDGVEWDWAATTPRSASAPGAPSAPVFRIYKETPAPSRCPETFRGACWTLPPQTGT